MNFIFDNQLLPHQFKQPVLYVTKPQISPEFSVFCCLFFFLVKLLFVFTWESFSTDVAADMFEHVAAYTCPRWISDLQITYAALVIGNINPVLVSDDRGNSVRARESKMSFMWPDRWYMRAEVQRWTSNSTSLLSHYMYLNGILWIGQAQD